MGLANIDKDQLSAVDVLLDVAQSLKVLLDGDALDTLIKRVHGLSDSERAQAAEARANIVAYQAQLKDLSDKKTILDDYNASLQADAAANKADFDKKSQELSVKQEAIDVANAEIESVKIDLANKLKAVADEAESQKTGRADIVAKIIDLDRRSAQVIKDEATAAQHMQDAISYEASVKEKAISVQKIIDGFSVNKPS